MDKMETRRNISETGPRHIMMHPWFGTFRIFGCSDQAKRQEILLELETIAKRRNKNDVRKNQI